MIRWLLGRSADNPENAMPASWLSDYRIIQRAEAYTERQLDQGDIVKGSKRVVGNRETERIIAEREKRAAAMVERPRLRRVS